MAPRIAATSRITTVTISRAAHHGSAVAIPAAIVARPKPSANTRKTAAPSARPIPIPSCEAFRLSSSAASSISSRTRVLACSATPLAVAPRPGDSGSVSGVCTASPVDHLREDDPGDERRTDDHHRRRAAAPLLPGLRLLLRRRLRGRARRRRCPRLRRLRLCDRCLRGRGGRRSAWLWVRRLTRRLVRRPVVLRAGLDQARLQLAQERRVVSQLLRQPFADAVPAGGGTVGQLQQARRAALDELVAVHFFTGGDSPVATRQIPEAARRAAIVAPAASPA